MSCKKPSRNKTKLQYIYKNVNTKILTTRAWVRRKRLARYCWKVRPHMGAHNGGNRQKNTHRSHKPKQHQWTTIQSCRIGVQTLRKYVLRGGHVVQMKHLHFDGITQTQHPLNNSKIKCSIHSPVATYTNSFPKQMLNPQPDTNVHEIFFKTNAQSPNHTHHTKRVSKRVV